MDAGLSFLRGKLNVIILQSQPALPKRCSGVMGEIEDTLEVL
jgi:hypothetical protein